MAPAEYEFFLSVYFLSNFSFFWSDDIMGLRLVADGKNEFCSKLNIEFQMADRGDFRVVFHD